MPRYSKQFKQEALALLESSGQSVNAISKQLGISDKSLTKWKQESELSGTDIHGELKRLEKENERLRMERDILKKAAAFFARGND